jgi:hypothetical protein
MMIDGIQGGDKPAGCFVSHPIETLISSYDDDYGTNTHFSVAV